MDALLIILKFVILGISLLTILSFYSAKSSAKKTTKEVFRVDFDKLATTYELSILRDVHSVNAVEPVYTAVIEGELVLRGLTSNSVTSDQFTTIGDVIVELPHQEILHYFEHTECPSDKIVARVAAFDRKIYVLSLQDYWLGESGDELSDQESQSVRESCGEFGAEGSEHSPLMSRTSKQNDEPIPEPVTSNVKVVGERPASDVEQRYFEPPKAGYGWVVSLVTIALVFALCLDDASPSDAMMAAGIYLFIIVLLIGAWIKRSQRVRTPFTVIKMRGEIASIYNDFEAKRIRFRRPSNPKKYDDYEIPESWLDKVPLNQDIAFEVCVENRKVVSVQHHYSIADSAMKTNRPLNYYMRFVGLSLALSGLLFFGFVGAGKIPTMFGMLSQPDTAQIAKHSDLSVAANIGQRVSIKPFAAVCLAKLENSGRMGACNQYALFESMPDIDFQALSKPFIAELKQINDTVLRRQISSSYYARLKLYAAANGQKLEPQHNIISVNKAMVAEWAKWVQRNSSLKSFQRAKEDLLAIWKNIDDTNSCPSDDCWSQILADDSTDDGQYDYFKRQKISNLMDMKGEAVDLTLRLWRNEIIAATQQAAAHSNVIVHLINNRNREQAWNQLIDMRGFGYKVQSKKLFEQSYLEGVIQQVKKQQVLSLDYGVVSDVSIREQKTHVYIDTGYTDYKFRRNLIQLALATGLVFFGLIFGLLSLTAARAGRASNTSQQTSWIS